MNTNRRLWPRILGLVLILAAGLIVIAACGKKTPAEKTTEGMISEMVQKATEGKADIDFKSGQITVKTPDGNAVITSGGGTWPADLPEDITRFKAGSILTSTNTQTPNGRTWTVVFGGAGAEEAAAYIGDLKGDGWNVVMTSDVPGGTFTQLQKENYFIQLTYTANERNLAMNVIQQIGE